MKANLILPLLILFASWNAVGQLPNFTLSATSAPQTCLGNGSLAFTVIGIDPNASMAYQIFLLPNTTTPVATVNTPVAVNLVAGSYMVIATQTLGAESNTASTNITIQDEVIPLEYTLSADVECDSDGMITVNIISGNAVSYEIMEGPITAPPQDSNVFNDLPPGLYQVRVYDDCGDAVVVSVQIEDVEIALLINPGEFLSRPECDIIRVRNSYTSSDGIIKWPLTFVYTVYPPDGGPPVTLTQEESFGFNFNNTVNMELPYYEGSYYYDLQIIDACGNVFNENNNIVNVTSLISWEMETQFNPCNPDGILFDHFSGMLSPITIDFIEAPDGFDPEDFNSDHPDFDTDNISYGISYHQPGELIPIGEYTVMITDACGRESIQTLVITEENSFFHLETYFGNCGNSGVILHMAGKDAVVKEMIDGPEEFSGLYPVDLMGNPQENGDINLPNLPPGDYTIHVIDECGFEHIENFTIVGLPDAEPIIQQLPGCIEGYGSIRIEPAESYISEAYIIEAPATYTNALPSNIIDYMDIGTGLISMNSLPEGNYKFAITTPCSTFVIDYIVEGYEVYINEYELTPHCGAFDLFIDHASNNNYSYTYWLQKYDEDENTWDILLPECRMLKMNGLLILMVCSFSIG